MKKVFSLLLIIGFSVITYSQCSTGCISGNLTITLGQTLTFSSANLAQCTSCYDWDINSSATSTDNQTVGNVKIIGSDMNKTVQIQGLALGSFSIQLTYFDETGCHQCCFNGTVIPVGTNCNAPDIDGWFECQNSNTGGQIIILGSTSVSWANILKIEIELNGATFVAAPYTGQNLITLNGPFTDGFAKHVYSPACAYQKSFGAFVRFYYKNGCPMVQKVGNYFDQGTPPKSLAKVNNTITLSPNPTNSIINFDGINMEKYTITIFDENGKIILENSKIEKSISIEKQKKGIYFYKISSESSVIKEGKIIKE